MTELVGLDVGTTGVKAIAITPSGEVIASAEESYLLSTPRPGWSEQDPEDWVRASEKALARLGVETPRVGLSGQMHGLVCLDADDRVAIHERTLGASSSRTSYLPGPGTFHWRAPPLFMSAAWKLALPTM